MTGTVEEHDKNQMSTSEAEALLDQFKNHFQSISQERDELKAENHALKKQIDELKACVNCADYKKSCCNEGASYYCC